MTGTDADLRGHRKPGRHENGISDRPTGREVEQAERRLEFMGTGLVATLD